MVAEPIADLDAVNLLTPPFGAGCKGGPTWLDGPEACSTASTGRDCHWINPRPLNGRWDMEPPGGDPGAEALFDLINALKLGR